MALVVHSTDAVRPLGPRPALRAVLDNPLVGDFQSGSREFGTTTRGGARTMTSDDIWDVVVVGAGPAGSSAALSALDERPDARVLLLDRSDFPRDKSCGDGVAPHVFD